MIPCHRVVRSDGSTGPVRRRAAGQDRRCSTSKPPEGNEIAAQLVEPSMKLNDAARDLIGRRAPTPPWSPSTPTAAPRSASSGSRWSPRPTATNSSPPIWPSTRRSATSATTRAWPSPSSRRRAPGQAMRPYLAITGTARIVEGGAPELLAELAKTMLAPGTPFPPATRPPDYLTRIRIDKVGGVGPWVVLTANPALPIARCAIMRSTPRRGHHMRRWLALLIAALAALGGLLAPSASAASIPIGRLGEPLRVDFEGLVADVTVNNSCLRPPPPGFGYPPRAPRYQGVPRRHHHHAGEGAHAVRHGHHLPVPRCHPDRRRLRATQQRRPRRTAVRACRTRRSGQTFTGGV